MLAILSVMLLAVVLAAVVVLYAAFPYRGAETPFSPWWGQALRRGVDRLPTIDPSAALEEVPQATRAR